ncbi:RecA-superfamily ATPase possibly involved in signal transduction [Aciduliprofundum sp. MAR08-339]|uniref:ATPase domain-containing protein n=1 Tax=Aciduliprofundum sp. (strain MAR08-339) TaxID=673860 RepID=UPI0002A4A55E|nr:RecA-superfamily ATPase possibly involved in signal transduction [Aciduliprofundum sp. MAR08-339]
MRISTGIEDLDNLMGGGFIEGSFNLVVGSQGAGKTLFAVNYLLHHALEGDVLYVSLEESWKNIVSNMPRGMRHRYANVRENVHYLDFSAVRPVLGKKALDVKLLGEVITTSMNVHNAKIVALDGISPLLPYYRGVQELRAAIFELSQRIRRIGGTMLFTAERNMANTGSVEEYVADSVILLRYDGTKRRIQIMKVRGSDFVRGLHGFEITERGLKVYPNFLPKERQTKFRKVTFGIKGMERILGEIYSGSVILVTGPPGTGKTLMAYQFLNESARENGKCVFVSFKDTESMILKHAREFGFELSECSILEKNPVNVDAYEFMWEIYQHSKSATRVVIDGINNVGESAESQKIEHEIVKNFKSRGVTTLVTYTTPRIISSYNLGTSKILYLSDIIIDLRYAEIGSELRKFMVVVKSMGMNYEKGIIEYDIGPKGIKILGKAELMEGVISGIPRHLEMKKRVEKFFK